MAHDSYYPQKYITKEGKIETHYVWLSKVKTAKHAALTCKQTLKFADIYDEPVSDAPAIKTPTRNRILQQSRQKRNTNHFKKEIYPTLQRGSDEQKHFARKHGLK